MIKPNDDIVLLGDWQKAKEICSQATNEETCRIAADSAYQKVQKIDKDLGCEWTRKPQNYDALTKKIAFKGINIKLSPKCHAKVIPESGHASDVKVVQTEYEYEKLSTSSPRNRKK